MKFIDYEVNNFHGLNGFFGKIIASKKCMKTYYYFLKNYPRKRFIHIEVIH